MKRFTKLGRTLLALTVLFILPLSDALSQNLLMETSGATYNATCGAVIRFKSPTGKIDDNGGVNPIGSDLTNAVKGVVEYANDGGTQTVLGSGGFTGKFYYSSLYLSGTSAKTVQDAIFVSGEACATFLPGYDDLGVYPYFAEGGDRTYAGTLSYESSTSVNIFGENQTTSGSDYNTLALIGTGPFNILSTDDVIVEGSISLDALGALNVDGGLTTGSDPSVLAGNVTIDNAGSIENGTGVLTFDGDLNITDGLLTSVSGSGPVTFSENSEVVIGTDGSLNFADATTLTISGLISSTAPSTNLTFGCFSNVIYDYASTITPQSLLATTFANPYGNLTIKGIGDKESSGDIFMCNNFTLEDRDFDMGATNVLAMLEDGVNPSYESDEFEVIGKFRRYFNSSASELIFNNAETSITLTSNAASVEYLTLFNNPGAGTDGDIPEWTDNSDYPDRAYNFDYEDGANNNWGATFKFGYKNTEFTGDETLLRFREKLTPTTSEKIATGSLKTETAGTTFSNVSLANFRPTGGLVPPQSVLSEVADDALVFLYGGPTTFISIAHGRWSNPGTWDEGIEPSPTDSAVVRHQVHTGFIRTAGDNYVTPEAYPTTLAKGVYIEDGNGTLLFGQIASQGAQSPLAIFNYNNALTSVINNASTDATFADPNTAALTTFAATAPGSYSRRGLIVFEGATIGAKWLNNTGYIHNGGIIEITE